MRIIGCDLHARQQTLAMLDTATGEVVKTTLKHEGDNVREFYSALPLPVHRSHWIDAVVCEPQQVENGRACSSCVRREQMAASRRGGVS